MIKSILEFQAAQNTGLYVYFVRRIALLERMIYDYLDEEYNFYIWRVTTKTTL